MNDLLASAWSPRPSIVTRMSVEHFFAGKYVACAMNGMARGNCCDDADTRLTQARTTSRRLTKPKGRSSLLSLDFETRFLEDNGIDCAFRPSQLTLVYDKHDMKFPTPMYPNSSTSSRRQLAPRRKRAPLFSKDSLSPPVPRMTK